MSEAKKWMKHIARDTPNARDTPKRKSPAKALKVERPPIPEDTLEALRLKYSMPTSAPASAIAESDLEMWQLTCGIKGWLTKDKDKDKDMGMKCLFWPRLREIFDQAIAENNPTAFEQFAKVWVKAEIRKTVRRKSVTSVKPSNTQEASLAESIENLLPNLPSNSPNSPIAIQILDIIEKLQRRLKRAPTQAEIVFSSAKTKVDGLNKQEVSRQIGTMGIVDLISQH